MQLDKEALRLAQTHFYTLGAPRNVTLSDDPRYIYFTRSSSGMLTVQSLWRMQLEDGHEELVFDAQQDDSKTELTPEEEKQRERLRETSAGISSYSLATDGRYISFTFAGKLWLLETATLRAQPFEHVQQAFDPRFSPDGTNIAYVTSEGLWVVAADPAAKPVLIAKNESETVFWGRAEFIASEEFERYRGYWWSPDGAEIVAARVDESAVQDTYVTSENPWQKPGSFKYPSAGTGNAIVTLEIFSKDGKSRQRITWDNHALPYLINVQWNESGLFLTVQSRDQTIIELYGVSPNGSTKMAHQETDKEWVDILQPLPKVLEDGSIIGLGSGYEMRRLTYNGKAVTPESRHVDDYIGIFEGHIVFTASPDPKERVVFVTNIKTGDTKQLSPSEGLFSATVAKWGLLVMGTEYRSSTKVSHLYPSLGKKPQVLPFTFNTEEPAHRPDPQFFTATADKLECSLVLPENYTEEQKLPVLLQVYGGPHHQEVLYSRNRFLESQWWANQGFAVLSTDGPGTPGVNISWEKRIKDNLISEPASAHIEALRSALKKFPFLDASKVAVRGWSFGGYLSAFMSMLYPDEIHASISGAPVTDWKLYDTHYTERYLGLPDKNPDAYNESSLLRAAEKATRPLLLIHGLQDDNVLFANSLQLSHKLAASNCEFQFIPLSGASHFSKQAEQQAWLLQMELTFLRSQFSK